MSARRIGPRIQPPVLLHARSPQDSNAVAQQQQQQQELPQAATSAWSPASSWSSPPQATSQVAAPSSAVYSPPATMSMEPSQYTSAATTPLSSSDSASPSSEAVAATSTSLPSFSSTSLPSLSSSTESASPTASSSSTPTSQSFFHGPIVKNVPLMLIICVGSVVMAATIIGALAWVLRCKNRRRRLHRRKRLDPSTWSPSAGSSTFSFTAQNMAEKNSLLASPRPALLTTTTGAHGADPRGKDVVPVLPYVETSVPSGNGWALFDNPVRPSIPFPPPPARRYSGASSGAPSAESIHQVYTNAEGQFAYGQLLSEKQATEGSTLTSRHGVRNGAWSSTTLHVTNPMDRVFNKSPLSNTFAQQDLSVLPAKGDEEDIPAFVDPFEQSTIGPSSRRGSSAEKSASHHSSAGVFSTISSSFLRATGLGRRDSSTIEAGRDVESGLPAGTAKDGEFTVVTLGRRDSQLPCTRRLTKSDRRFKCDENSSGEEDNVPAIVEDMVDSPDSSLAPPAALGKSPGAISTPGMAGVGSAFAAPPNVSHLVNPFVGFLRVPEPVAMFGTQPARFSKSREAAQWQQILASGLHTDKERAALEASIARWQERSKNAGTPSSTISRRGVSLPLSKRIEADALSEDSASNYDSVSSPSLPSQRGGVELSDRSQTTTTLFSPVTSISEYSSESSKRGLFVKEALDVRKAGGTGVDVSTMAEWLAAGNITSSPSSDEGSAIVFGGSAVSAAPKPVEEKLGVVSAGEAILAARSRMTQQAPSNPKVRTLLSSDDDLRSSTQGMVAGVSRHSTRKSATSATTSTYVPSLFDEVCAREIKAVKRRERRKSAAAAAAAAEASAQKVAPAAAVTAATGKYDGLRRSATRKRSKSDLRGLRGSQSYAEEGPDLDHLAEQIDSMLSNDDLFPRDHQRSEDEQQQQQKQRRRSRGSVVTPAQAPSHAVNKLIVRNKTEISPVTSSDSEISARRWNKAPTYRITMDEFTGKRKTRQQQQDAQQQKALEEEQRQRSAPALTRQQSRRGRAVSMGSSAADILAQYRGLVVQPDDDGEHRERRRSSSGASSAKADDRSRQHHHHRQLLEEQERLQQQQRRRVVSTPSSAAVKRDVPSSAESSPAQLAYLDEGQWHDQQVQRHWR